MWNIHIQNSQLGYPGLYIFSLCAFYLLWSGGTGHEVGTLSRQCKWHANPQISQTTPWRVKPTMSEVQWLHFNGELKVRIRNWWDLAFGPTWMACWMCEIGGWGGGWVGWGGWIVDVVDVLRPPIAGETLSCWK